MGNEYYQYHHQSQQSTGRTKVRQQRGSQDPLLRELSALSRAPSLRDPSTSSVWKASAPSPQHQSKAEKESARRHHRERGFPIEEEQEEQEEDEGEEDDDEQGGEETLRTGWQDKVVNWIDGGLREGERKQELLRSISELLNSKMEPPPERTQGAKLRKNGSLDNHNRTALSHSNNSNTLSHSSNSNSNQRARKKEPESTRKTGRIGWREETGSEQDSQEPSSRALALTRHQKNSFIRNESQPDPGYDYEESDTSSSSGDETDGLVSHTQSPLLAMHNTAPVSSGNSNSNKNKERRVRRHRKMASNGTHTSCANFRFNLGSHHPTSSSSSSYKPLPKSGPGSDTFDGSTETSSHGCGLPWPYWSRPKGKTWLEMAGRSLSCGGGSLYPEVIPRRKLTGQEIVPAENQGTSNLSYHEEDGRSQRHRSLSQKYRPRTFREIVGQNMLVQALGNAVTRGRIAPVYLFHGPRGTGKTSAARILAAALNCTAAVEEARPCGVCRECLRLCLGKSPDVREVDVSAAVGNLMNRLMAEVGVPPSGGGRYRVFIIDECHTLSSEGWTGFTKCLEEPPGYAVFILTTTDPEQLPHPVITRCQKFHFPKIREPDMVARLQRLASKEGLEVETEALELIAGRSNGSLRDAETTLEQLGLVGQRITLQVVQELVGLVSNGKLADLLDWALSGDTLNTVKCIREFMDAGVEPLALMSQIATLITDILGGGYVPASDKGFFQKHTLTKDQLEKLRKALKTLSESEKQIRSSQDQTTWLTAALLQFAPDQSQAVPVICAISSAETSGAPSVLAANDTSEKDTIEWEPGQMMKQQSWDEFEHHHLSSSLSGQLHSLHLDSENISAIQESRAQYPGPDGERVALERHQKLADTWIRVLEVSQSTILKQLLWNHGRLLSISIEGGRAMAYIEFQHPEHRSSAERSKTSISHAFQLVLGFPVDIRLQLTGEPKSDEKKHFSNEPKAPLSPPKTSSAQIEFLNSRSFPAFRGRSSKADEEDKISWEHAVEEFPGVSIKSGSSENQSDHELKLATLHGVGRQSFQNPGRRFKLKTVRNLNDLSSEAPAQAKQEAKNQKPGSRQKHGTSLLCWKANKVNEDDDAETVHEERIDR